MFLGRILGLHARFGTSTFQRQFRDLIYGSASRIEIAQWVRGHGIWHHEFRYHVRNGDSYRDARDWSQAFFHYRSALDILPLHSGFFVQAGHMLKEMGEPEGAEGYYRSAVVLGSPIEEVGEHLLFVSHENGYGETLSNITSAIAQVKRRDVDAERWPTMDDIAALAELFSRDGTISTREILAWMRARLSYADVVRAFQERKQSRPLLFGVIHDLPRTGARNAVPGPGRTGSKLFSRLFDRTSGGGAAAGISALPAAKIGEKSIAAIAAGAHSNALPPPSLQATAAPRSTAKPSITNPKPRHQRWRSPWGMSGVLAEIGAMVVAPESLSRAVIERCAALTHRCPAKVSVVMPTWNRAHVVSRAIDSVRAQTAKVFELIVIDDGSDDGTVDLIASKYAAEIEAGWLILIETKHGGISKARNAGLKIARGDLIAYLDSDNHWHPLFTQIMTAPFAEAPALGAAYCCERIQDLDKGTTKILGINYQRENLINRNFIDLNCFMHRSHIVKQQGMFDEDMTRLVDWEFIIRITKYNPPAFVPVTLVEYYLDAKKLKNVTLTENWDSNFQLVARKHCQERIGYGIDPLRIAYVVWDWPALSQTFVMNELRWLISNGFDVRVYYKTAPDLAVDIDFAVSATQVETYEQLAELLQEDRRNVIHSPFAYPATALLTWPAARIAHVPFSFMPGGVDICHHSNRQRNQIGEVANDPLCKGVITLGSFHETLLKESGVPSIKIVPERQAVGLLEFKAQAFSGKRARLKAIAIGRFIEKKGLRYLLQASVHLPDIDFEIYGYGPLEKDLRALAEELQVSNVSFMGTLDDTEALHRAYYNADLFVLPCVEAENGDMDGLPTVIIEAMSAGVPVVTTRLANIPDLITDRATGMLVPPKDVEALVSAIRHIIGLSVVDRTRLIEAARERAIGYASTGRMMQTMLDIWRGRSIDIALVTYDTPQYDDWDVTSEIIDRIYEHTTMPFNLIVVDNGSQRSFREKMRSRYGDRDNFNFVELGVNTFCGPATNVALAMGSSEYFIYVCSKEGFVLKNGWEREMVRQMDAHPAAAMGGYLISLAKFRNGAEYTTYESFKDWRNQEFARSNPDRRFQHVQGGLYILRRDAFLDAGGFSDVVVQNGTDIEYSYYLESRGYELLDIPDIYSISSKTLPPTASLLDEGIFAIHPLTKADGGRFDRVAAKIGNYCPLCASTSDFRASNDPLDPGVCADCGSSAFDRSAMRFLSLSGVLQRRPTVAMLCDRDALMKANLKVCPKFRTEYPNPNLSRSLAAALDPAPGLLVIDHLEWRSQEIEEIIPAVRSYVKGGGRALVGEALGETSLLDTLTAAQLDMALVSHYGAVAGFDIRPIAAIGFPDTRSMTRVIGTGPVGTSLAHRIL